MTCFLLGQGVTQERGMGSAPAGLVAYCDHFTELMATKLPRLHSHFQSLDIQPMAFFAEWFMALFAKSVATDLVMLVCDLFLAKLEDTLILVGLGLLSLAESQLLDIHSEEDLLLTFKQVIRGLPTKEAICAALSLNLPPGAWALSPLAIEGDQEDLLYRIEANDRPGPGADAPPAAAELSTEGAGPGHDRRKEGDCRPSPWPSSLPP